MSKKRINIIMIVVLMAFILSGCSNSTEIITLETPFSEVTNDGFFAAIFTYPLAQAINFLETKVGIFFAITIVTLVLNAIILAFTFKTNIGMQKMQEMMPEQQRIQAKYEGRDDNASKQRMAMEMQQLYSKYNINPLGMMAVQFIQFPVLIGMYNAIRRSSAVANASFMGVHLSTTPKDAIVNKLWVCVVIFVLMVVFQLISIKLPSWLANRKAAKEAAKHHKRYEKPEQQNPMMTYGMLVMIGFVMFSLPSALSLYYCIYSVVNILKIFAINILTSKKENE